MTMKPKVKVSWKKLQERYTYPVDVLGRKIRANDRITLRVWHNEGIDQMMALPKQKPA